MKSDCALFSSLYIFCQTRDGDLDEFFKREKDEMEAYLGVCVTMGINNSPKLADDWSSDIFMIHNDGIKQTMSKNRFEEISQFFHLNIIRAVQMSSRSYLNIENAHRCYSPKKKISIEGMIAFKGRLFCRYLPAKPTKNGIKVWTAADASNGYVVNFSVYQGKGKTGEFTD